MNTLTKQYAAKLSYSIGEIIWKQNGKPTESFSLAQPEYKHLKKVVGHADMLEKFDNKKYTVVVNKNQGKVTIMLEED
jgi:hypothetical protein